MRFPLILLASLPWPATTAFAQTRPLATEEAHTATAGTVTLELGASALSQEPNFLTRAPRDRWDGPELRLVYSAADNVEIDADWPVRIGARDDPGFGNVSDYGDLSLRAKVRVAGSPDGGSAVGFRFGVSLPQTSFGNGLGPNALRMTAQVLVSQALGTATVHLNGGIAIHDEPLRAHEQRDLFAYGLALTQPLGAITLAGEVAGLAGQGSPGADARSEARAGLRIGNGRVRGDVAARRGVTRAAGKWGVTAGLTMRLR